jgi:polyferredoxin
LLGVTVLVFFFLDSGHLITLIPKLMGSEGVTAMAGEVGQRHVETYSQPLALLSLAVTLGLTFVAGRAVCGYGCPVGTVQELAYDIPIRSKGKGKVTLPTKATFSIRLVVLGIIVGLYLAFGFDLIQAIAPYQLWTLELVFPGVFVIAAFFVASIFTYRPFCRLFCPYGAVASPVAKFSRFKLEKAESCVNCGLCDKECPTGEISKRYGECYLCGRCLHACKVDAIKYPKIG